MKKWASLLVVAGLFLVSGYAGLGLLPPKTDITDYAIIQIMGIDKAEDGDIIVTLTSRHGVQSSETSVNTQVIETMTGKGETVVQAIEQIDIVSNRIQQLGYLDFVLIGEEAARESIVKCLDYVMRNPQSNYQESVFVVRGKTARELIDSALSENRLLSDTLKNFFVTGSDYSTTTPLSLIDLITQLDTPGTTAEIPALRTISADGFQMKGGEPPDCGVVCDGHAIISNLKLTGFIEQPLERALNLLRHTGNHSVLSIYDEDGGFVSLNLNRSTRKITPVIENGKIKTLKLEFLISSYFAEQTSNVDLLNDETIHRIEKEASELVAGELGAAINQMVTFGELPCFLAERVRLSNPVAYFDMENSLADAIKGMTYDLRVRVVLKHQFDIKQPNGGEMFGANRLIGTGGRTEIPEQSLVYQDPLLGEEHLQEHKDDSGGGSEDGSGGEGGSDKGGGS
ncbi:MAG: hypothetical protein LBO63_05105 [Oscillospiraceae bacterium]|jgi:spore germination protein KC|nr:hypothetical protein [Oscillospiraceae bacterium]